MVTYEAEIIYKFADHLYKKAKSVILTNTLLGFGISLLLCFFVGYFTREAGAVQGFIPAIIVGTAGGYLIGKEKAFTMKLQAQTALVMVKIEENTRVLSAASKIQRSVALTEKAASLTPSVAQESKSLAFVPDVPAPLKPTGPAEPVSESKETLSKKTGSVLGLS